MGPLFSSADDRRAERELNKLMTEILTGKLDEIPLPRADEQLAVLPPRLGRLHTLYQLDGSQYIASILGIDCRELANVQDVGQKHLYVRLQFGSWDGETAVQEGTGSEAAWEKLSMYFPTSDRAMRGQTLRVQVLDYSSFRAHVVIGEAHINMSSFVDHVGLTGSMADHVGRQVDVVVDLLDTQGKRSGKITLFIKLEVAVEVFITRIVCSDLKNVDFMGSNDPYVMVKFGAWSAKTLYQDDAGSTAEWNKLRFWLQATHKMLQADTLSIQVYDYNAIMAHAFIGEATVSIQSLLATSGVLTEFTTDIHNKRGRKSGQVTLSIKLEPPRDPGSVDPDMGAGSKELQQEAVEALSEIKGLSDWGGNWRMMAMPSSNLVSTLVDIMARDYFVDPEHDVMSHAEKYSSDKKQQTAPTSVLAVQIIKNLAMANLTGVIISDPQHAVLRALAAVYFALAGTKRRARRNEACLEDIVTACWYLLDTHKERRDLSDIERLLQSWRMTVRQKAGFQEVSVLREFICCMLFTFKVFSWRHWDPVEYDVRREIEVAALKVLMNVFDDSSAGNIERLGVLRVLVALATVPFNRETLILLEAHELGETCVASLPPP